MLRALLQRMGNSAYISRLGKTFPIFAFILLLQALLCVHLLNESYAAQMSSLAFLKIWGVATFRSFFWASLAWALVAWPHTPGKRRLVSGVVVVFFSIFHLFESYLLGKYGEGYTFSVVTILLATTPAESKEYLTTVFSLQDLLRGVFEVVIVSLVAFGLPQILRKLPVVKRCQSLVLPLFVFCSALSLCNLLIFTPRIYSYASKTRVPIDVTLSPIDRLLWNTGFAYAEISKIRANISKIQRMDLGELEVQQPYGNINIVVIMGESLRRDYMHCYGYPLENTPNMDRLIEDGSMIAYSDVISPAASTVESLTKVLTYLSLGSQGAWYDYPCLPNVLTRSGYDTYWVSNQEIAGDFVQPLQDIAHMASHTRYVKMRTEASDWRLHEGIGYDMEVIPYLHKLDSTRRNSIVQFVHLMGLHYAYDLRYPKSHSRFSSQDIKAKSGKEQIAHYVNCVYYNDDVIAHIVQYYQNEKTLLFYFSDHGESLFDAPGKPNFFGHGLPLKTNVEIPFMVYVSPKLRAEFPELYDRIVRCKDRPIVNDLFTNSLLALLGIKSKYSNEKLEYFSDGYDTSRPRRPVTMNRSFSYEK